MVLTVNVDKKDYALTVLEGFDKMKRERQQFDFLIKVGSEEIPVHRNILSSVSDYFKAMFLHDTKEKQSGVVEMIDVDPECVKVCVNFIYSGEASIPEEKCEQLMHVAHLMLLSKLCDGIAATLEANLDPKSFYVVRRLANMYGCKELEEKCERFGEENFGLISKEEEFGQLDKSYIKKMIASKNVKISEEKKLDALLRWIKYDSERNKTLAEMLKCINLADIPVDYRRYLIEEDKLFYENSDCMRLLYSSILNTMKVPIRTRGDRKFGAIVVLDRNSGHLQCFNPTDNTLTQMHEMNDDMKEYYFSAVSLDNHIYVLMGNKSDYRLKYSDKTARWEKRAEMIESHGYCPPATVLSGCIYVIGGHVGCSTKSVEKYDPALNQWIELADKPQASQYSEVLASHGYIYSLGGKVGRNYTNKVEQFEPTLSTWTELAPMKEAKGWVAAVEMDEKIYVLGGSTKGDLHSMDCYDPSTNQWTTQKPMKTARSWLRGFLIDGIIYAVGGYYSSPDSIEKFDPEKNEWEMVEIPGNMKRMIKESVEIKLSS